MTRLADDAYLTQDALALAICQKLRSLGVKFVQNVLEPSAGEGAFVRAVQVTWPHAEVISVEPRAEAAAKIQYGAVVPSTLEEYATPAQQRWSDFDLVVGNPPYKHAEDHVRLARAMCDSGGHVAFLLRMSFLSSQGRVQRLWDAQPGLRWLIPLAQRPTFVAGGGTDNSEYAVFVWQTNYTGRAEITEHLWVK